MGGTITADDAVWLDDDDELVRRAVDDPSSVDGGILTSVVTRGKRDLLRRLLDAGADITARDDEFSSTLAWAARSNAVQMVEFLLARRAPTSLPDDEPWATPLAWAKRRQHKEVVSILRRHGANR